MINFRLPSITGRDDHEKLESMRRYLIQLVNELQYADTNSVAVTYYGKDGRPVSGGGGGGSSPTDKEESALSIFNDIKSLIIKNADIIDAYYEEINKKLVGEYVAKSEFGTFQQKVSNDITANANGIQQNFQNIQSIDSTVESLEIAVLGVSARIKTGLLYYDDAGVPVYGVEIGQTNEVGGEKVFDKFARFTSDRLSFYDQNGSEVAYISDYQMSITNADVKDSMTIGEFKITTEDGLVFRGR